MTSLLVFLTGFVFPPKFTLIIGYLVVRSVSSLLNIPPLLKYSYADLYLPDIFLIGIIFRYLLDILRRKAKLRFPIFGHLPGLVLFLLVMLGSTVFSLFLKGYDFFLQEITSFLRFMVVPLVVIFILPAYKYNKSDFLLMLRILRFTGYLVALTIYLGVLFHVGEVNQVVGYTGMYRYQGVLGDSVKMFLLPFIFWEMVRKNIIMFTYLGIALLLTGGRVGFVGLVAGIGYLIIREKKLRKIHIYILVGVSIIMIGYYANLGGIRTRIMEKQLMEYGLKTRIETWKLALYMGRDNWVWGAGFGAYRLLYNDYVNEYASFYSFNTDTFSQILRVFVDGGIIGLIAFLWMVKNFLDLAKVETITCKKHDESLHSFFYALKVTVIVFVITSIYAVWLNPGSKVGYAIMTFIAIALSIKVNFSRNLKSSMLVSKSGPVKAYFDQNKWDR